MKSVEVAGSTRRRAAGVSLIEALVALAVMAFGLLGVVGMQSTMRSGADISRQRSEAVRIAQEQLEQLRNYSVLRASDAASGQLAFEEIVATPAASVAASNANTTFVLETLVPNAPASDAMALVRQVRVTVAWADRSASAPNQRVELSSVIAGLPAELSALHALRTDRSLFSQPYGRNSAIPRNATNNPDGVTSTFVPPGLSGETWVFNNTTGLLRRCAPSCSASFDRGLLSGYVAFATGDEPTQAEAEIPSDPVVSLVMRVVVTLPASSIQTCATESVGTDRLAYYCAIPTENLTGGRRWSGRVEFSSLALSATFADKTPSNYKICRYTPDKVNRESPTGVNLGPPSVDAPTGQTNSQYNSRHPYAYFQAVGPQVNKNFLVISAGDGTDEFSCPTEDPATPIESNTWPHQPIS